MKDNNVGGWEINPLFGVFELDVIDPEGLNPLIDDHENLQVYDREYLYEKVLYKDSVAYQNLFDFMKKRFQSLLLSQEDDDDFNCPIVMITYIFSVSLAINAEYRGKFYNAFQGDVPCILQYLFESIKIGPIKGNIIINTFSYGNYNEKVFSRLGLAGTCYCSDLLKETYGFNRILA